MLRQLFTSKENILAFILALTFSILNILDVVVYKFRQPPHTIYIGITHWYQDYFFYLSQLTQGARGEWLTHNAFTTEYTTPNLIWWYNIVLGKISAMFHLYPWTAFDGSVFLLSFFYIIISYKILVIIFPQSATNRICALLVFLTSTNLFTVTFNNVFSIQPITYFYAYTSAFNRIGGVSHLIAQNIISILLICLFAHHIAHLSSYKKMLMRSAAASLLSVALFIISPVFILTDLITYGLLILWSLRSLIQNKTLIMASAPLLISGMALLPFYLWYQKAFADPFFEFMRTWETSIPQTSIHTFLLSTGIITVLVLWGIPKYLRNATQLKRIGIIYALLPIALYYSPLPHILKLPSFRFFQPPAYIFFAAITIEGFRMIRTVRGQKNNIVVGILTGLFILIQVPVFYRDILDKLGHYYLDSTINYVDIDVYRGLEALKNKSHNVNALATNNLELLVPVISGLTVYSGHLTLTLHYEQKVTEVYNFYTGKMSQQEALAFLTRAHIGYILWNKQNGQTNLLSYYPFLKISYENPMIVIFVPK